DPRLKLWRGHLPEADSLMTRVDRLIDYLRDKRTTSQQPALLLLLWTLAEKYDPADERHDNLLALASELAYGLRVTLPPNSPSDPQLERKIRESSAMLDIPTWIAHLAMLKDQVCRIAVSFDSSVAYGTGFLVAPAIVMTNYHVIERVIRDQIPATSVSLLFDYHLLEDGVTPHVGQSYALAQHGWLIDASPYSPFDLQITAEANPDLDQLDYALLRVDGAPGNEQVVRLVGTDTQRVQRGWRRLPPPASASAALAPNSPLLIVQHPDGKELKLAIDTDAIIAVNGNGTRVRYRTNTEPGSSGSPCFDANWNLVALHHSGDPNYAPLYRPQYNQGIPFAAIVRLLEQRGKLAALQAA
ncbi:MAG: serine protease, partial [Chloroflexales bacterium]|nr:serine protease [Chloroflexales bacterium]